MNIAICIPTLYYPEAVDEVLKNSLSVYKKYGIDVFYFDSNEDNLTENIINHWMNEGYDNLFFIKMDSDCTFGDKIERIIQLNNYSTKKYDYIWPMKNRVYFCENAISYLINVIEKEDNDLIVIGQIVDDTVRTTTYHNPVEYYHRWGWLVASTDIVIFKYSSMFNAFDLSLYKRDFPNVYKSWNLWITQFVRLAEIEKPNIKFIMEKEVKKRDSSKGKSLWTKSLFEVWVDSWLEANTLLPSIYEPYKHDVILKGTSMSMVLGGEKRLHELYLEGILTIEEIEQREAIWNKISVVPIEIARKIAKGEYYEKDILDTSDSEVISLLLSIYNMLDNGDFGLARANVPFADISVLLFDRYGKKSYCSSSKMNLLSRSLDYYCERFDKEDVSINECKEIIVTIINFFLLLN